MRNVVVKGMAKMCRLHEGMVKSLKVVGDIIRMRGYLQGMVSTRGVRECSGCVKLLRA